MNLTKNQKLQKLFSIVALAVVLLLPIMSYAATTDFKTLVSGITTGILAPLVPLIIGLAVIVFLWGVLKFITAAGDEKKRKEGKDFIIWGLVGITIMFSIWGLVKILTGTLNLDNTIPTIPQLS
ncbi:MAG: hypothetical protein WC673_01665 [Candidatus Paceibacterota bacterium]|jgi:hypothetical protein